MGKDSVEKSAKRLFLSALLASAVYGCAIYPDPITRDQKAALVAQDRGVLFQEQEPVTGPISLAEAMARAIKYNMNHRLRLMEEALSQKQLDMTEISMLPRLAASAGFQDRSNLTSSIGTGALEASTSSDRARHDGNLIMSWNILDFGVSYFQTKQDADRALIAAERKRKVIHNLMRDVRFAFWKAVSAQNIESQVNPLLVEVEQALENSKMLENEGLPTPTEAMQYQRALIEIIRQLKTVQTELVRSRMELADLMNLEPGTNYKLDAKDGDARSIPNIGLSIEEMEQMALMNLPELWEENYQERIGVLETKKAIARMFPGIEFGGGWNYDSNSYLVNHDWLSVSSRLTWNLLNLFSAPQQMSLAETQETVTRTRRLALSTAALSQVHIAHQNFLSTIEQMKLLDRLNDIDQKLLQQALNQQQANLLGQLDRIRGSVQALATRMQRDQAFALLQNAVGLLRVTTGVDPLPQIVEGHDIATLTKAIEENMNRWSDGVGSKATNNVEKNMREVPAVAVAAKVQEDVSTPPVLPPSPKMTADKTTIKAKQIGDGAEKNITKSGNSSDEITLYKRTKPEEKIESREEKQKRVDGLMSEAAKRFNMDHITRPKSANALDTYRKVLEIDPGNRFAGQGISNVTARLVVLGRKDVENLRLTGFGGDNALEKFRTVLSIDPKNEDAQEGLETIVDRLLRLAQQYSSDTKKSRAYLDQAETILPGNVKISETRASLSPKHSDKPMTMAMEMPIN
ncbi:MAG: TolC family protein [Magnetococcales bacterium]|nr:TolC family protein [Magnetococcales bacterium]